MALDRGYHVKLPNVDPSKKRPNAFLRSGTDRLGLWVHELITGFEMGGNTGQSRLRRQFFPHNFVQPVVTITGQMPNSFQYNRLAEFVRDAQIRNLTQSGVLTFELLSGGIKTRRPIMKGRHRGWFLEGYIKSIPRGAERFLNAPEFSFDFVISRSIDGLFQEPRVNYKARQLLTWTEIFHSGHIGFIDQPQTEDESPRSTPSPPSRFDPEAPPGPIGPTGDPGAPPGPIGPTE